MFLDGSVLGIDEGTNQSVDSDCLSKPEPDFEDSNLSFPDNSQQSGYNSTMHSEFKYGKLIIKSLNVFFCKKKANSSQ